MCRDCFLGWSSRGLDCSAGILLVIGGGKGCAPPLMRDFSFIGLQRLPDPQRRDVLDYSAQVGANLHRARSSIRTRETW